MGTAKLKNSIKLGLIEFLQRVERRPRRYDGAVVTLYHEVGRQHSAYCIVDAVLREQIDYLVKQQATWFTATELAHSIRRCETSNNICITFDDGTLSSYQATLEMLDRGAKCTQFIIPGRVDGGHENSMSWAQIRELDAAGVEIGSHSVSHPHLPRLDDTALENELVSSRLTLEDKLGKPITSFAYPYGEFDQRVTRAVTDAGYDCAFTTRHLYASPTVDIYQIPRFEPLRSARYLDDLMQGRAQLFYRLLNDYYRFRDAAT